MDTLSSFSHTALAVALLLDGVSVDLELNCTGAGLQQELHVRDINAACILACQQLVEAVALAGFSTLLLSSSDWVRATANPVVSTLRASRRRTPSRTTLLLTGPGDRRRSPGGGERSVRRAAFGAVRQAHRVRAKLRQRTS